MSKRTPPPRVKVVMASTGDHDAAVIALRDFHDPRKAASVLRAMAARGTLHPEFAAALADYLDAAREALAGHVDTMTNAGWAQRTCRGE